MSLDRGKRAVRLRSRSWVGATSLTATSGAAPLLLFIVLLSPSFTHTLSQAVGFLAWIYQGLTHGFICPYCEIWRCEAHPSDVLKLRLENSATPLGRLHLHISLTPALVRQRGLLVGDVNAHP